MIENRIETVRRFNEAMSGYNNFWLENNIRVFYEHGDKYKDVIIIKGVFIQDGVLGTPENITKEFADYGIYSRKEFIELLEKLSMLET